ncbi:MAG: hypothetical protein DRG33_02685 [Deltaproteobacteria bacterium]|nr:MAG: hypothetical protein DRG33_02685 [Deltaproteobacteria bacterium]
MQLQQVDLIALSRSDLQQGRLHFDKPGVLEDHGSVGRLVRAGIVENDGRLTKAGLALLDKVRKTEALLQKGVPFEKRTKADPKKMLTDGRLQWKTGKVSSKAILTNSEVLFIGTAKKKFDPKPGSTELKRKLHLTVAKALRGEFQEVWPHTFQIENLGGIEIIWLSNAEQNLWVAIQAKYYDFLRDRYPTGRWFAASAEKTVQVRVRNRGWKDGVVALVQPLEMSDWKDWPTVRRDWGSGKEKMQAV